MALFLVLVVVKVWLRLSVHTASVRSISNKWMTLTFNLNTLNMALNCLSLTIYYYQIQRQLGSWLYEAMHTQTLCDGQQRAYM